ncbi:MAG: hypothetical protein Aurels2KO_55280 [Aureliella sp.]
MEGYIQSFCADGTMQLNNRRTLRQETLETRQLLATLVVSSPDDTGPGTLRQAIIDSNHLSGPDEITFDLPEDQLALHPESPLPAITDSVTIDASTQHGDSGVPAVGLYGWLLDEGSSGLTVEANAVTVRGLAIAGFGHAGIFVDEATGSVIEHNYLGMSPSGIGYGNGVGIHLYNATNAEIGGANSGNVISGNQDAGVVIAGELAANNRVQGNMIGTDPTGNLARTNRVGILIDAGAHDNIVGVDASTDINTLHRNVISGNSERGVSINSGSGNTIAGNLIGTNAAGNASVGPQRVGISIINGSSGNLVGGSSRQEANVISGNSRHGVFIRRSNGNQVSGNRIGTTADGITELGNDYNGIWVTYSQRNVIGTNGDGIRDSFEGNLVSGNGCGIYFGHAFQSTIAGNLIGTDVTGTTALPNRVGAHLGNGSTQNTIGTNGDGVSDQMELNVISGNDRNAIELNDSRQNYVSGNWLGLGSDASIVANGHSGIWINNGSTGNVIGGLTDAHRNTISGNLYEGISIAADNNQVLGNYIGTSPDGLAPAGNERHNIRISTEASENVIGGPNAQSRNIIADAGLDGIFLDGSPLTHIVGNWLGIGADGETLLGNTRDGIAVHGGTVLLSIGGSRTGEGNVIAANGRHGIGALWMWDSFVRGNSIGVTSSGAIASNSEAAIRIDSSYNNFIGDGTEDGANSITSVGSPAVSIVGDSQNVYVNRNDFITDALPVDLREDGPTQNDPGDFDFGPNRMQNYRPVLAVSNTPLRSTVTVGPIDAPTTPYYDYVYAVSTDEAGLLYYRYVAELENLADNPPELGGIYRLPPLSPGEKIALISHDTSNGSSEFSPLAPVSANLPVTLKGGDQYDEGETISGEVARGDFPMDDSLVVRLSSQDSRVQSTTVTIAAGASTAPFAMAIEDDDRRQATLPLILLAEADTTAATGSARFTIRRSDTWHNDLMPLDATGDGNVAPNDVLAIVNALNTGIAGLLPDDNHSEQFVDVNGDQHLSPIDALQIINALNSADGGEGERNDATDVALTRLDITADDELFPSWDWLADKRKDRMQRPT